MQRKAQRFAIVKQSLWILLLDKRSPWVPNLEHGYSFFHIFKNKVVKIAKSEIENGGTLVEKEISQSNFGYHFKFQALSFREVQMRLSCVSKSVS